MAAALLGVAGCGKALQPAAVTWEPVNAASLRAARQRWAAARIEVYDYRPYCEVSSRGQRHGRLQPPVSVRQGRVISSLTRPLSTPSGLLEHPEALTIDGIFGVLEHSAPERRLTAVFDRDTGVPLELCEPLDNGGWAYCAVSSFHVPHRHPGNPERLRWPRSTPWVTGSCPHSDSYTGSYGPSSGPGSPG